MSSNQSENSLDRYSSGTLAQGLWGTRATAWPRRVAARIVTGGDGVIEGARGRLLAAMPLLALPDTTLFYTDQGEGPPLVLVHGYTCDSFDWTWSLPRLLERFRVIAFDRRGEGRSASAADLSMDRQ